MLRSKATIGNKKDIVLALRMKLRKMVVEVVMVMMVVEVVMVMMVVEVVMVMIFNFY